MLSGLQSVATSQNAHCFCLRRYRLVPQVFFPEQIYDVMRATRYFLQPDVLDKYKVDPARVGVSGDSAGGNLAAALGQQVTALPQGARGKGEHAR